MTKKTKKIDIEKILQSRRNRTWLDWEREEQTITDIEEERENEIDEKGREKND